MKLMFQMFPSFLTISPKSDDSKSVRTVSTSICGWIQSIINLKKCNVKTKPSFERAKKKQV